MNRHRTKEQQGFNLAELLIAMAILGIGLAIAIPGFGYLTKSNYLSTQASEIQTAMNYARNEAIRLNDSVLFCHSADGSLCSPPPSSGWQGWIIRAAGATIGAEQGPVLRQGLIQTGYLQVSASGLPSPVTYAIRYNPQGLARHFGTNTPLSGSINVCTTQSGVALNLYSVRFSSGGRSEVEKINNSGVCP